MRTTNSTCVTNAKLVTAVTPCHAQARHSHPQSYSFSKETEALATKMMVAVVFRVGVRREFGRSGESVFSIKNIKEDICKKYAYF